MENLSIFAPTLWNIELSFSNTLWKLLYFLTPPMESHVIMCQPYGISTLVSHTLWKFHYPQFMIP